MTRCATCVITAATTRRCTPTPARTSTGGRSSSTASWATASFGENLTTSGINISAALVGEQWLIGGSLLLQVTVPRIPCTSFQSALGEKRWVKRFTERGVSGTYLRVLRAGSVRAGDSIVVVERPQHHISNWMAFRAITVEPELLDLMLDVPDLPAELRDTAVKRATAVAR